jgi:hypothetical protein
MACLRRHHLPTAQTADPQLDAHCCEKVDHTAWKILLIFSVSGSQLPVIEDLTRP